MKSRADMGRRDSGSKVQLDWKPTPNCPSLLLRADTLISPPPSQEW